MILGPSDWDIRLVAVVPSKQVEEWIPKATTKFSRTPSTWVSNVAHDIRTNGVKEWYKAGNSIIVGVDRKTSTIVYRNATNGID